MNRYHVVKITSSGLGDAIKALLAGALYSEVSNRTLVVDWRKSRYSNADENTFYSLFALDNISSSEQMPNQGSVAPPAWRKRLHLSMHEVYTQDDWSDWNRDEVIDTYSVDFANENCTEAVTVSWDFDQVDKLLSHYPSIASVAELFRYAANKFLLVNPSIADDIEQRLQTLPQRYLAAHIRATDEFDENKGPVDVQRYFDLISMNTVNADQTFFIASDNQGIQQALKANYPNVITVDKWFAKSGQALHLSKDCPDKLENAKSALRDILLLANSTILICNPSSCFSECAQYFSPYSDQRIVNVVNKSDSVFQLKKYVRYAAHLIGLR